LTRRYECVSGNRNHDQDCTYTQCELTRRLRLKELLKIGNFHIQQNQGRYFVGQHEVILCLQNMVDFPHIFNLPTYLNYGMSVYDHVFRRILTPVGLKNVGKKRNVGFVIDAWLQALAAIHMKSELSWDITKRKVVCRVTSQTCPQKLLHGKFIRDPM